MPIRRMAAQPNQEEQAGHDAPEQHDERRVVPEVEFEAKQSFHSLVVLALTGKLERPADDAALRRGKQGQTDVR